MVTRVMYASPSSDMRMCVHILIGTVTYSRIS